MNDTNSSLIFRIRDTADAESWREFAAVYEPLIYRYLRRRGLDEGDASDVVQEVFVRLVRSLPEFRLDRSIGRFRTWLWQVTNSACVDWVRRNHKRINAEDGWKQSKREEPEWIEDHRQRVLEFALQRVRGQSTTRAWNCFEMHLLRGRPGAEVARELGCGVEAVYTHTSRVLKKVREQCSRYLEDLNDDPDGLPGGA